MSYSITDPQNKRDISYFKIVGGVMQIIPPTPLAKKYANGSKRMFAVTDAYVCCVWAWKLLQSWFFALK